MGCGDENVEWVYSTLGTTLLGVFLFNEKLSFPQVVCVILIVTGIVGLKILAKERGV